MQERPKYVDFLEIVINQMWNQVFVGKDIIWYLFVELRVICNPLLYGVSRPSRSGAHGKHTHGWDGPKFCPFKWFSIPLDASVFLFHVQCRLHQLISTEICSAIVLVDEIDHC